MLIATRDLELIAAGRVTVAFRRWIRPTVKSGGRLRTAVGVLAIDSVETIAEADIAASDAVAAGFADVPSLLAMVSKRSEYPLYRIRLHFDGSDPRAELRADAKWSAQQAESVRTTVARMDKSSSRGAWTRRTLEAIRNNPSRRAADLARLLDVEKEWLKINIRKLKELGLTESLEVGYRLSPRGDALVSALARGDAGGGSCSTPASTLDD